MAELVKPNFESLLIFIFNFPVKMQLIAYLTFPSLVFLMRNHFYTNREGK